jgi:hypothetical protein
MHHQPLPSKRKEIHPIRSAREGDRSTHSGSGSGSGSRGGGGGVVTHHQRQQHRRPQQTADNAVTGRHVRDVALRLSMCRAYFSWSAVRWWYFLRRVGMEGGMCVWIWVWLGRWTVRTGAAAVLAKWGGFGFALLCFAHSCGRGCRCGCGCACGCVRGQLGELR